MRTSKVSGAEYVYDVMYCGNLRRIQEVLRVKLEVFQFLCSELQMKCHLKSSKFIAIEEKVAMFLWTVAHSASNRDAQEWFQHSGETVSRYFHEVLEAINSLIPEYIKLPNINISTTITSNSKYYNFFNLLEAFPHRPIQSHFAPLWSKKACSSYESIVSIDSKTEGTVCIWLWNCGTVNVIPNLAAKRIASSCHTSFLKPISLFFPCQAALKRCWIANRSWLSSHCVCTVFCAIGESIEIGFWSLGNGSVPVKMWRRLRGIKRCLARAIWPFRRMAIFRWYLVIPQNGQIKFRFVPNAA